MSQREYEALRHMAVTALAAAMLSACGAGLDEVDTRPVLDANAACPNPQPDGTCKPAPKVGE